MKALMLAFNYTLPYHVLRAASRAGMQVHTLGAGPSRGLQLSRFSAGFRALTFNPAKPDIASVLAQISAECRRLNPDIILPADDLATEILAALRPLLPVRTIELPSPALFNRLNDKWTFYELALSAGASTPQSWRYESAGALLRDLQNGALSLPLMIKPRARSGGDGVRPLRTLEDVAGLERHNYRDFVVQRFVEGLEVSIDVICRNGEIVSSVVQQYDSTRFSLMSLPEAVENVGRIMRLVGFSGVACLDAIVDSSGRAHLLECNPRFWCSIGMVSVLGPNFAGIAAGMDRQQIELRADDSVEARIGRAMYVSLLRPWTWSANDRRMIRYYIDDAISMLCARYSLFERRGGMLVPRLTEALDEFLGATPAEREPSFDACVAA